MTNYDKLRGSGKLLIGFGWLIATALLVLSFYWIDRINRDWRAEGVTVPTVLISIIPASFILSAIRLLIRMDKVSENLTRIHRLHELEQKLEEWDRLTTDEKVSFLKELEFLIRLVTTTIGDI